MAAIDAVHAEDPNRMLVDGVDRPAELVHAELVTSWVQRLDPAADEAQLLAARAAHLRRWDLRRDAYPDGRSGYLRWRTTQKRRHGEEVARILRDLGRDEALVERVEAIVAKQGLGTDPAVQTHEDALCLTFLVTDYGDLAERLGEERTVEVLRRTLAKMSEPGRAAALDLTLPPGGRELLERALAR